MLSECAPSHTIDETDHYYRIRFKTKTYPSFPKQLQIDVGHIRKMIRHLEIDMACAKKHLAVLQG